MLLRMATLEAIRSGAVTVPRVRRLKSLGLTESLAVGYGLSPRGEVVWRALREDSRL